MKLLFLFTVGLLINQLSAESKAEKAKKASAEKEVGKAVVNLFNEKIDDKFQEAAKEVEGILNKQLGSHMKQAKAKMLIKEIAEKKLPAKNMKAGSEDKCGPQCKVKKLASLVKGKKVNPNLLKTAFQGAKAHHPAHNTANRLRKNNGGPPINPAQPQPNPQQNPNLNPFHSQPWPASPDQQPPPQAAGAPQQPPAPQAPGAPGTCPAPCSDACSPKCSQDCCRPMMPLQNFPPPPQLMPASPPPPPFMPPGPPAVPSCPGSCYNHCFAHCPNGCCGVLRKRKRKTIPKVGDSDDHDVQTRTIISTKKVNEPDSNAVERNQISSMKQGSEKAV